MAAIQVSRLVRLALEERWAAQFNDNLAAVALEYGIYAQVYQINFAEFSELKQNFYRSPVAVEDLLSFHEPQFPTMAMWISSVRSFSPGESDYETPHTFCGEVTCDWRVFLTAKGRSLAKLADLREATDSAMSQTLIPEFSERMRFRDNFSCGAQAATWMDQDPANAGFLQQLDYRASFSITIL